jgi:multidrug efflux pump subunit AcrB
MAGQLQEAFSGVTADDIQVGTESYEIDVRLNPEDQDSIADFDYFQFTLSDGTLIPLSEVVDVESSRGWARIARVDGLRTVTIRGDIDSRVLKVTSLIGKLEKGFLPQFHKEHPDVIVSYEGEIKEGRTTGESILKAMLVGLIGVFILLSFQFRSYIEPFVVMLAIPPALIGITLGHLIVGIDMSLPSLLGFISLSGVVVNDSILLVLFLKNEIGRGRNILEAAAQASRQRFRAVMLTSMTTIAGLIPLIFERSLQAQVIIPLAVSIAFGMMASTILVLLGIPCVYAILADLGLIDAEEAKEPQAHS